MLLCIYLCIISDEQNHQMEEIQLQILFNSYSPKDLIVNLNFPHRKQNL